jgi:hypothetical protein
MQTIPGPLCDTLMDLCERLEQGSGPGSKKLFMGIVYGMAAAQADPEVADALLFDTRALLGTGLENALLLATALRAAMERTP